MAGVNPNASASVASGVSSVSSAGNLSSTAAAEAQTSSSTPEKSPLSRKQEVFESKQPAEAAYSAPTPEELSKKFKS